jgi:NDP-mannose synthase
MHYGITDVTLTLGHLAEMIQAYFSYRKQLTEKLTLRYVREEIPSGTAGSLALVEGLTETFLVMNGDLLTNLDLKELLDFHHQQGAVLTIATHQRQVKIDLGVLEFDAQNRITGYREKPESVYHVSMGIYVYEPKVLQYVAAGQYLDFPTLVLRLLEAGEKVCAFPTDCVWLDIGRPDDYARAQQLYAEQRKDFDYV